MNKKQLQKILPIAVIMIVALSVTVRLQITPVEMGDFYIDGTKVTQTNQTIPVSTRELDIQYVATQSLVNVGDNLVINPSFELDNNTDGIPDDWATQAGSGTIYSSSWDSSVAYAGQYSAKISISNYSGSYGSARWYQSYDAEEIPAKFKEATTYRFRCAFKVEGAVSVVVMRVLFHDVNWQWPSGVSFRLDAPASTTWVVSDWLEFTMPSGAEWTSLEHVQIYAGLFNIGSLWVDAFEAFEVRGSAEDIVSVEVELNGATVTLQQSTSTVWAEPYTLPSDGAFTLNGFVTVNGQRTNVASATIILDSTVEPPIDLPPIEPPPLPTLPLNYVLVLSAIAGASLAFLLVRRTKRK